MDNLLKIVENKTNINKKQIEAVLKLVEEGGTIPFIARYRKEVTGNLDEEQIREIVLIYEYEKKLNERKEEVRRLIKEKDKLTQEVNKLINDCVTLSEVEDVYLPYKEKKKTRATTAISYGLEPFAIDILKCQNLNIEQEAKKYLNDNVIDVNIALQGAKDIIAENFSENFDIRKELRDYIKKYGSIVTSVKKDAEDLNKVYELYYDKSEMIRSIVPHRVLAINRGEKEGVLKVKIDINAEEYLTTAIDKFIKKQNTTEYQILLDAISDGFKRLLFPSIEREIRSELTENAHNQAINVFALNLEQLLLTPPLKNRVILGFDPAFRTGCKLAVIDRNGDFIYKDVIYPHEKRLGEAIDEVRRAEAESKLVGIIKSFKVELIAIGNGTASRESEEFVSQTIKRNSLSCMYVIVSEAGASVYSASKEAIEEFPNLHVEERSAISIARRVLDPLSELIKIDPKSIGVGQYQHDVNQSKLDSTLDFIISKVVNNVGVNLNSASVQLLGYVSGLNKKTAKNIVEYRSKKGLIKNREELAKIKGVGDKVYEQSVGFLKIFESENPLDKTFIHPENYKKVEKILQDLNLNISNIGTDDIESAFTSVDLNKIESKYDIGTYTIKDIVYELKKPLRDIRDDYPSPVLKSDVLHIEDLQIGMKLEGMVRSVVDFGAFVDIGLKNDALIHKSKLSKNRINHPLDVINVVMILEVYVLSV